MHGARGAWCKGCMTTVHGARGAWQQCMVPEVHGADDARQQCTMQGGGAQCRWWCMEAMHGGSSAWCWQCMPGARCIPPCSRLAVYLGHSCAKHQVCWKASRRARIPRGGICPRERRLTFPSLGCGNNTGAHPALSLGQADPPPPPSLTPQSPSHTLSTSGEGVHGVGGVRPVSGATLELMCMGRADPRPPHGEHSPKWGHA